MIKTLLHLVRADFVLFFRVRLALFWTFAFPLLLLIMQMALFGDSPKLGPVRLAIRDLDHSQASMDYARQLHAGLRHQQSVEILVTNVPADATPSATHPDMVLTIPADFAANLEAGVSNRLLLDSRMPAGPAQDATYGLLRGLSDGYNLTGLQTPPRVVLPPPQASQANPLGYGLYLVTGLAGMIILSTGLMGFAGPLVAAREGGMFRMYQLFPIPTWLVVLAWWLTRLFITLAASLAMFAVAWVVYGVRIDADAAAIGMALLVLALGTGAFLSLGLLVASFSNSVAAAAMLCNLLYFPLLFSGNLMIPVGGLPAFLRSMLDCLPLNAMVSSMRRCLTIGLTARPDWQAETYSVVILSTMLVACLVVSGRRFTWLPRT